MPDLTVFARLFHGSYAGQGSWVDIAGESRQYQVHETIQVEPARLVVQYRHDFFQEGTSTEGEFIFEFVSERIFTAVLKGMPLGSGYIFDNYLHFNLKAGEAYVETSYTRLGDSLLVRGSSTANAQGRFIAWAETLQAEAARPE